jgi:hypothetical protein
MPKYSQTQYISSTELRLRFNEGGYWQKAKSLELLQVVSGSWPAPPQSGQPPGTLSMIIEYRTIAGEKVALVHQYLLPNGNIGGSGMPDPKALVEDGILYLAQPPGP